MIGETLTFVRKYLDDRLRIDLGGAGDDPVADKVVFVDGDQLDPLAFKLGAVSLLLIDVNEERLNRGAGPFVRHTEANHTLRVQPDLRLSLHLLFVARFKEYQSAWSHLSKVLQYLHSAPVLDAACAPGLPPRVGKLTFELLTLDFNAMNQLWGALRTTLHPAVLYRVNLVTLPHRGAVDTSPVERVEVAVGRKL